MNRLEMSILAFAALAVAVPAQAQTSGAADTPVSAAVVSTAAPEAGAAPSVEAATPAPIEARKVSLRTLGELSSSTAKLGDIVSFEVAEDIVVDGKLVVAAGSRAFGEVSRVQRKRNWGRPGSIEARITYLMAGNERVALDGTIATTGELRRKKAIRTSLLIAPFCGFWIHGREAVLPSNAIAFLAGDTALALAAKAAPVSVASAEPVVAPPVASVAAAPLVVAAAFTPATSGEPAAVSAAFVTGDILR